jgi:hypothetical protein
MPCGESEHLDPSLTDHHCRVHISVGLVPASLAVEDRLALAILPRHMPAGGACLTGERRWYFNHPHARRLGLLLDPTPYLAPTGGEDLSVEHRLLAHFSSRSLPSAFGAVRHLPDLEGFQGDDVVGSNEVGGALLGPILPSVPILTPQLGNGQRNGKRKTASLGGRRHREFRRWISASGCVPSGEREAWDGGRDDTAAQVVAASATAEPHGPSGIRRHAVHRLSCRCLADSSLLALWGIRQGLLFARYSASWSWAAGLILPDGSSRPSSRPAASSCSTAWPVASLP